MASFQIDPQLSRYVFGICSIEDNGFDSDAMISLIKTKFGPGQRLMETGLRAAFKTFIETEVLSDPVRAAVFLYTMEGVEIMTNGRDASAKYTQTIFTYVTAMSGDIVKEIELTVHSVFRNLWDFLAQNLPLQQKFIQLLQQRVSEFVALYPEKASSIGM
jgi:hypothetical protein